MTINRRSFIKVSATAGVVASMTPSFGSAAEQVAVVKTKVFVVEGTDIKAMLKAGMEKMGGWAAFVKSGKKATVKPNIGWARTAEQGANTLPELVSEIITECKTAGASEVVVPENTCDQADKCFEDSGVGAAVKKAGGRLYAAKKEEHYVEKDIPGAVQLKKAKVVRDVIDTGCLIDVPVAKSHGSASLTIAMKNWMGSVLDRGYWHRNNLHQCIADFCLIVKPNLVIIDATRIMLEKGPKGPGKLAHPNKLIFSTDQVAADAVATTLFDMKPFDIKYIKIAHDMKIGCGDLEQIDIQNIKV
jgi:uncharacterized protein (DUF362 family)